MTGARHTGVPAMLAAAALAVVLLVLAGTEPAGAAFPGANGRIFFESNRSGFKEVWSVDPTSTATPAKLVGIKDGNAEANPSVSPDGSRVAFERLSGIWVMNSSGTAPMQLTAPTSVTDSQPTWSPDGTRIAFTRGNSANRDIWVMNADGSEQRKVIGASNTHEFDPAWSPDGSKIAFTRGNCDELPGISAQCVYTQNADGSGTPTNLTPKLPNNDQRCERLNDTGLYGQSSQPAWSPSGQQIAFRSLPDCQENRFSGREIWVMNAADGSAAQNVTADDDEDQHPAFSPDGQAIAFASDRDNSDFEVYTIPATGGTITQITSTASSVRDENPDWSLTRPACATSNGSPNASLTGTSGNDTITGTTGNDVICGLGGDDRIDGLGGNDIMLGDAGNDTLVGDAGMDTLSGGADRDTASFAGAATAVEASLLSGFAQRTGTTPLQGVALVGIESLTGSAFGDSLSGSNAANVLKGNDGADDLAGLGGQDKIHSRDGVRNDTVNGGKGTDQCTTDRREVSIKSCE